MTAPDEMHAWMIDKDVEVTDVSMKVNVLEDMLADLRADHNTLAEIFDQANRPDPVVVEPDPESPPQPEPEPPVEPSPVLFPAGTNTIDRPGVYIIEDPIGEVEIRADDVHIQNHARIGVVRYGGDYQRTSVAGGHVGSIWAEGLQIQEAHWEHMQMDGLIGGTAFNVGGSDLSIMAINAQVSRYGFYGWRCSRVDIQDAVFNSLVDDQEEAAFRLETCSDVMVNACEFESHTKYCCRAHGVSARITIRNSILRGRWFQFGNHDYDQIDDLTLEGNRIFLDHDAPYAVLTRARTRNLKYINNRHYDWANYNSLGTVEEAYGDMIPRWEIRGNEYL